MPSHAHAHMRESWLQGLRSAMDLLYNATQDVPCYDVSTSTGPASPGQVCAAPIGTLIPGCLCIALLIDAPSAQAPAVRAVCR